MKLTIQQYLLTCLAEECAEVQHRIAKGLRFGLDEKQKGHDETNETRIANELTDLLAVCELLHINGVSVMSGTRAEIRAKMEKVHKYMDYSRSLGTLE